MKYLALLLILLVPSLASAKPLEMVVIYGQSNAVTPCAGSYPPIHPEDCAIASAAPMFPQSAWRFNTGSRVMGGVFATLHTVLDPTTLTSLVPLNEEAQGAGNGVCPNCGETFGETMASRLAWGIQPMDVLVTVTAVGGMPLQYLLPKYQPYANTIAAIKAAMPLAQAAGYDSLHVHSLWLIHGESDQLTYHTNPMAYDVEVWQLYQDFCQDSQAITGQTDCPLFYLTQATEPNIGGIDIGVGQSWVNYWWKGKIETFAPLYWGHYLGDKIHLLGISEAKLGEYAAHAYRGSAVEGGYFQPLQFSQAWLENDRVLVDVFSGPQRPLVIDTTHDAVDATVGFDYTDTCGSKITGALYDGTYIELLLNQVPTCPTGTLTYGPHVGLQQVIHDSNTAISQVDGTPLWNYALATRLPVQMAP